MSDLLAKALHGVMPPESDKHFADDPLGSYCERFAARLRNHPNRLRIAASLLTAEDVRVAVDRSLGWHDSFGLSDREAALVLAALSGEHSDDH
jgi:hypothetical protein